MAPPRVLPTAATAMTLQNSSGLALMTANTAGSEPSGTSVADTRLIRNTDVSPTSGAASRCSSQAIADSIIGLLGIRERCHYNDSHIARLNSPVRAHPARTSTPAPPGHPPDS